MENEEIMENDTKELTINDNEMIQSFDELKQNKRSNTKINIYTTIEDKKKIFNLDDSCDKKINDCKYEKLRIKDILIRRIEKPLENPEIDEETGEIIRDKEVKLITILIDEQDKSYVTASKSFGIKMLKYIDMFGISSIKGLEIQITEKEVKNSSNKALSFELL